jgi:hypothetical protein
VAGVLVGVTQVMSRNWVAQLNYAYDRSQGYLTDPYRILSGVDGSGSVTGYRYESRPDTRVRQSLYWGPTYMSADPRLAAFTATTIGVKFGVKMGHTGELSLRLEEYQQKPTDRTSSLSELQGLDLNPGVKAASPCELLVETPDGEKALALGRIVESEARRIEAKFSRYRGDSVISAINRGAGTVFQVDAETAAGPWRVAIERPDTDREARMLLEVTQGGLATSGDTHRHLIRDGMRYGHILAGLTSHPRPRTISGVVCESAVISSAAISRASACPSSSASAASCRRDSNAAPSERFARKSS